LSRRNITPLPSKVFLVISLPESRTFSYQNSQRTMLRSRKTGSTTSTTTTTVLPPAPSTEGSNSKPINDDMMLRSTKKNDGSVSSSKKQPSSSASSSKKPEASRQWGNLAFAMANAKKAAEHAAKSHQKEYAKNANAYRMKLCIYTVMCLGLMGVGWFLYPEMEPAAKHFYAEHKDLLNKPQELLRGAVTTSPHAEANKEIRADEKGGGGGSSSGGEVGIPTRPKAHKTKDEFFDETPDNAGTPEDETLTSKSEGDVPGGDLIGASMPKACVSKVFRRGQPDLHDGTIVVDCHEYHYMAKFDGMQGKTVVGVLSESYKQRMLIRESWAKLTDTKVYFIVNGPFSKVEREYNDSQDLIFIDKPSFQPKNPAINTLGFMLIAEQHGPSFENIFLTTEDVFLDMKIVEEQLAAGGFKDEVTTAFPTRMIPRELSMCAVQAISTEVETDSEPFQLLDLLAKDCNMKGPIHIDSNSQIRDESTMKFFYKNALGSNRLRA